MSKEKQPPATHISLQEWQRQWYESLAGAPWRIWCSNTPPDEEEAYFDGRADSGDPDPRGDCGRIREPLKAGDLFSIRLVPDRETRDDIGCRSQARYAEGYEYPLCFINETLTEDSVVGLAAALQEIRDRHEFDLLDAAGFLTHVVMWFDGWQRAERGSPSVFDVLPIMPADSSPLDFDVADEMTFRLETPISELASVLRFWDAQGRRLSGYLAVRPLDTGARASYTRLPPSYLSHEGTQQHQAVDMAASAGIELEEDETITITYSRYSFFKKGTMWVLVFDGRVEFGNDTDGMLYIATLLNKPGVHIHVADLKGVPRDATAGDIADSASIQAIRDEIADYDVQIESAEGPEREILMEERDVLIENISASVGLGGRPRRLKDPMDSVRTSVQQACRRALRHIHQIHPALAHHLDQHLDYGLTCMYKPANPPINWAT